METCFEFKSKTVCESCGNDRPGFVVRCNTCGADICNRCEGATGTKCGKCIKAENLKE